MSLDGKLLSQARSRLRKRKDANEAEYDARRAEVYAKAPRIRQIDAELQQTLSVMISSALSHGENVHSAIDAAEKQAMLLRSERASALAALGYSKSWLDENPVCCKCKDTGYVGSEPCQCLMELYRQEQNSSLSSLLKLGRETFDTFNLDYYDDTFDPSLGKSVRSHMEGIYESCREYARKFKSVKYNLFLNGATGLGKTFLSACIARVVAESGFSVVYETAPALFEVFEREKFSRDIDEEARREIRRYMTCDLLILDDLGTELTTSFSISVLYNLINTRLISAVKTVISSNYSLDELRGRYSPQIMSRLEGEYIALPFYGTDIRLQKHGQL